MKTRNIREVKVGDKMYDRGIYLGAVIEVLENVFALSEPLNGLDLKEWITFRTAESMGWNIENEVGVDDSEEFTKEELQEIKQLAESECNKCFGVNYMGGFRDLYDRIYYKANKMLKEKE